MDSNTVAEVFVVALALGIAATVAAMVRPTGRALLTRWAPVAAGLVAVAATLGSLYFSEIADFVPCRLCWFQRTAMYPLALILSIAAVRRDRRVFVYALPLAVIGSLVSAYHVREQLFPPETDSCDILNPCSARWVDAFGAFTIPEMAGTSFVLITVLGIWTLRTHDR